MSARFPLPL